MLLTEKLDAYQSHLVDFMSIRHMIYMIAAELLVSTDTRNHLYAMRQRGSILKRYLRKKPLVFLQHGVTALKKVDFSMERKIRFLQFVCGNLGF